MKKYLLSLLCIGFVNFIIAQNELAVLTPKNISTFSKSITTNANTVYLNSMAKIDVSKKVQKLQEMAANYDITKESVYSKNSESTYTVVFKEASNTIEAIYDASGELQSSKEHYQGIKLPYALSLKLVKEYPGWAVENVICNMQYKKQSEITEQYKVVLNKNNKSKTVRINN